MEVDLEHEVAGSNLTEYDSSLVPDGDIILSLPGPAASSGRRVLHRVDKVILSRHSSVFTSLFSLPYDSSANEELEGIPVIRLDDDPKHMGRLLEYLYDPSSIFWTASNRDFYVRAMGLLSVARKYEVLSIREFIVQALEKDWPTALLGWIFRHGEIQKLEALNNVSSELVEAVWTDEQFPEPAVAGRIALDLGVPSILPAAMYCLSNIEAKDDWDRYHRFQWDFGDQSAHEEDEEDPSTRCDVRPAGRSLTETLRITC